MSTFSRRAVVLGLAAALSLGAVTTAGTAAAATGPCNVPNVFEFSFPDSAYETDALEYSARSVVGCAGSENYEYSLQIWQIDADGEVHSLVDRAARTNGGSFLSSGDIPLAHRDLGTTIWGSFTSPTGSRQLSALVQSCHPDIAPALDFGTGYLGSTLTGELNPVAPAPSCPAAQITRWHISGYDPDLRAERELASGVGSSIAFQPDRLYGPAPLFGYDIHVDLTNAFGEDWQAVEVIQQEDHAPVIGAVTSSAPLDGPLDGVELQASASDEDPTDTLSYRWSMDGADVLYYNGPRFQFGSVPPGPHSVRLVVTDQWGLSTTWSADVTATPNPVHAAVRLAEPDSGAPAPRTVRYDASASTGSHRSFHWAYDDGTSADTTRPRATKVWTQSCRTATGTVTVTDDAGHRDTAVLPEVVLGGRLAAVTAPTFASANRPAALHAATTDCAGAPADLSGRFSWDFGDGSVGTGRAPRHAWAAPGDYQVIVTWRYGQERASASVTVHVGSAHAALTATPSFCFGSCTAVFRFGGSTGALLPDNAGGPPVEHAIAAWTLSFGDGSAPLSGAGPLPTSVRHRYGWGRFQPALTVTDTAGNTDTATVSVTVGMGG